MICINCLSAKTISFLFYSTGHLMFFHFVLFNNKPLLGSSCCPLRFVGIFFFCLNIWLHIVKFVFVLFCRQLRYGMASLKIVWYQGSFIPIINMFTSIQTVGREGRGECLLYILYLHGPLTLVLCVSVLPFKSRISCVFYATNYGVCLIRVILYIFLITVLIINL